MGKFFFNLNLRGQEKCVLAKNKRRGKAQLKLKGMEHDLLAAIYFAYQN